MNISKYQHVFAILFVSLSLTSYSVARPDIAITEEELRHVERAYYQIDKALVNQLVLQDQTRLNQLRPILHQIEQSTAAFRSGSSRP